MKVVARRQQCGEKLIETKRYRLRNHRADIFRAGCAWPPRGAVGLARRELMEDVLARELLSSQLYLEFSLKVGIGKVQAKLEL